MEEFEKENTRKKNKDFQIIQNTNDIIDIFLDLKIDLGFTVFYPPNQDDLKEK